MSNDSRNTSPSVMTRNEIHEWVADAKPGDRIIYFHGNLAAAQHAPPRAHWRSQERAKAVRDLAEGVRHLHENDVISMSIVRDDNGYDYIATRRRPVPVEVEPEVYAPQRQWS